MTARAEQARKDLLYAIECAGFEPQAYTGRGMMGQECIGFIVEHGRNLVGAGAMVAQAACMDGEEEGERVTGLLTSCAYDSMGLHTIVYFPRMAWRS